MPRDASFDAVSDWSCSACCDEVDVIIPFCDALLKKDFNGLKLNTAVDEAADEGELDADDVVWSWRGNAVDDGANASADSNAKEYRKNLWYKWYEVVGFGIIVKTQAHAA